LAVQAVQAAEDADLDDFDDDDLDGPSDAPPGGGAAAEFQEDFDLDMPEEKRLLRMRACFAYSLARVQVHQEPLQQAIAGMVEHQGMSEDQAANTIVFTWVMTCYMNADDSTIEAASHNVVLEQDQEEALFTPHEGKQTPSSASKRQWDLLGKVVNENKEARERQQKQQQPPGASQARSPVDVPGAGMSGTNGALYMIIVFGVIFGAGILGVLRLMKSEEEGSKKKVKAEKKSSRKKE